MDTPFLEKTDNCETPKFLGKHFFDNTPVLTWNDDGVLYLNGKATELAYSEELGVVRQREQDKSDRQAGPAFDSEYDELDVFDKSRFDW